MVWFINLGYVLPYKLRLCVTVIEKGLSGSWPHDIHVGATQTGFDGWRWVKLMCYEALGVLITCGYVLLLKKIKLHISFYLYINLLAMFLSMKNYNWYVFTWLVEKKISPLTWCDHSWSGSGIPVTTGHARIHRLYYCGWEAAGDQLRCI